MFKRLVLGSLLSCMIASQALCTKSTSLLLKECLAAGLAGFALTTLFYRTCNAGVSNWQTFRDGTLFGLGCAFFTQVIKDYPGYKKEVPDTSTTSNTSKE